MQIYVLERLQSCINEFPGALHKMHLLKCLGVTVCLAFAWCIIYQFIGKQAVK